MIKAIGRQDSSQTMAQQGQLVVVESEVELKERTEAQSLVNDGFRGRGRVVG